MGHDVGDALRARAVRPRPRSAARRPARASATSCCMREVFDDAEDEVRARIAEVNPTLPADVLDSVAPQVGIGAVVFANLVTAAREGRRLRAGTRRVALEGDSGPVPPVQPRALRVDRAQGGRADHRASTASTSRKLAHDAEWAVAQQAARVPRDRRARGRQRASRTSSATTCSSSPATSRAGTRRQRRRGAARARATIAATRRARLALVAAVQATLRDGLSLLGIGAPDQM